MMNPYLRNPEEEEELDPRAALMQNMRQMQEMSAQNPNPDGSKLALLELLNQAGGRMGTLNGVSPSVDNNPLAKYQQVLAQAAEARKNGMMTGLGLKHKTLEYLNNKREATAAAKAKADAAAAAKRSQYDHESMIEGTRGKNRLDVEDRRGSNQRSTEMMRGNNQKDIEGLRGTNRLDVEGMRGKNQKEIAGMQISAAKEKAKNEPKKLSEGQKVLEKDAAKDISDFRKNSQRVIEDIRALTQASEALGRDNSLSGRFQGLLPDMALNVVNPAAGELKRKVESVALNSIKTLLSGTTSDKDVEIVLNKAFSKQAEPKENKKTVDKLIRSLKAAYEVRKRQMDHMQKYGTMEGFTEDLPTLQDIENALSEESKADKKRGLPPQPDLKIKRKEELPEEKNDLHSMSDEELKALHSRLKNSRLKGR